MNSQIRAAEYAKIASVTNIPIQDTKALLLFEKHLDGLGTMR